MAIVVGLVLAAAGAWGLILWFPDFLVVAKGLGSLSLFLGGCVALIIGVASLGQGRPDGKKKD